MLQDILLAVWFLLPAALANTAPVFAAALPPLKKYDAPIDAGKTWRGQPILGPHKTWRGIIAGVTVATFVLWIQKILTNQFVWTDWVSGEVDYYDLPLLILGPLFGIGALGGDAVKSFFKRRIGIRSGGSWIPFDQLDFVIGSLLLSSLFVTFSLKQYLWMFVVWFIAHMLISFIGYKIGLKKDPL